MIWVLLVLRSESYIGIMVASRSLFHYSPRICSARRVSVASRSKSSHKNINLFFYGFLWAGRRIPGMLALGSWSLVPDITIEVSLPNEVFNLVSEVVTLIGVMSMLSMEAIVYSLCSVPRGAS
ncbi:hypothetical protein BHM03_00031645 [Ensete ventricosum]|nr:hypothetical protein BHM03_00031645 [Ensete ventricosum]